MDLHYMRARAQTRRQFLKQCQTGIGAIALSSLLGRASRAAEQAALNPLAPRPPQFAAKAKSVIYLNMSGAPPQQDLFDYKPKLNALHMKPCPDSLLKGQRFAFIKGHPKLLGSPYKFAQHGKSGVWLSELLPNVGTVVDDVTFV